MPQPFIRQATFEDLPGCANVYVEAFSRPPYNENWTPEIAQELLQALMEKDPETCFCLIYEGEIAGIAFCSVVGRFRAVVEELAILPALQGIGWGRFLLDHCLSVFQGSGYPAVELIANGQAPAFHFYQKMGFRQTRRNVLMIREL